MRGLIFDFSFLRSLQQAGWHRQGVKNALLESLRSCFARSHRHEACDAIAAFTMDVVGPAFGGGTCRNIEAFRYFS